MEGILLVPPDRGTILGRAVWKPRYVVIGPLPQKDAHQANLSLSQVLSAARIRDIGGLSSKSHQRLPPQAIFFSIYKSKEDLEPVLQHSMTSITECQVQHLALRKQGHVLPTLVIQISPDPATDKLRKRRSSRTAGLTTTKDSGPTTLYLRPGEETRHALGDWARYIHGLIQPEVPGRQPMSPISPLSASFVNPFAPIHDVSEQSSSAPNSAKGKLRSRLQPRSSGRAQPKSRDQGSTHTSDSPSLRSRTSDISSHASAMLPAAMNFVQQHYANLQHSDLPSPASTSEYPEQFIEGWTSAQGRSSALSSPIRGRASTTSSAGPHKSSIDSSSPPQPPRETILDRAFQMRCIPGFDREVPGEEKLTSLAKFEALMRESEERAKAAKKESLAAVQEPMMSTWEEDDDSDERQEVDEDDDDDDSDEDAFEQGISPHDVDSSMFSALHFLANRHSINDGSRMSHYSDMGGLRSGPSVHRPHTAHSRSRPAAAQRTISQPYIPGPSLHIPSSPPSRPIDDFTKRWSHEKRHSTSDVRNMNFNDFAKRLSGTSSLLIMQSNTSDRSHESVEYDTPRGSFSPLTPSERDERCRWRGSIGVFGSNEGGFL
ncbi:hypothetical protein F5Y16DRAFT_378224 [Xylariaceae sp. FL0255]|nr:hypothetical protein F5Y16DRAFT_378224 [Xylariaceae sp. FL0255]